jgi:hypothetical protein
MSWLCGVAHSYIVAASKAASDLPSAPNGLRTALDGAARSARIALAPVIEADSLPLQKHLTAQEGLYTVLPLHVLCQEVQNGRLQRRASWTRRSSGS